MCLKSEQLLVLEIHTTLYFRRFCSRDISDLTNILSEFKQSIIPSEGDLTFNRPFFGLKNAFCFGAYYVNFLPLLGLNILSF